MKHLLRRLAVLPLLATFINHPATGYAQGTVFTYQGRLNVGSAPAHGSYDIAFTLFASNTGGSAVAGPVTNAAVAVSNGLFTTTVDLGNAFPGAARWLELAVSTNGANTFSPLAPRQALTATPYAITAGNVTGSVAAGQVSGVLASGNLPASPVFGGTVAAPAFTGSGANVTNVNAAALGGLGTSNFWQTAGNAGTTAGTHFLGTTDNQPLELRVNNQTGLRIETGGGNGVNVIGGDALNTIQSSAYSSTIAGGRENTIQADASFSTIGGGLYNKIQTNAYRSTIGGGENNNIWPNAIFSTIGGGWANTIQTNASYSTIGGGVGNNIWPSFGSSTIGGGYNNNIQANGGGSTIGGGQDNTIQTNAYYATIPGGVNNSATNYAFAAGRRAKANHTGTFVWADSQNADFNSTAGNQFLIRAAGGIGINTNNPNGAALNIAGTVVATTVQSANFTGNGGGLTNVNAPTLGGVASSNFWQLSGNNVAVGQFLGSTNNQPLEFRVNNRPVLRLEPTTGAPNLTGGGSFNSVYAGTKGAIIAGGELNTITTSSDRSVIGGGYDNGIESSLNSVVAGGTGNGIGTNSGNSVISGGNGNKVLASAGFATIPGGLLNSATNYAFAAGRRAKANHTGAFVWADSTDADFPSTAANQFRVRASGGMDLVGGNSVEAFKFSGSRSGGFGSPIAYGVNNNTAGSSAPVLRLVSSGGNSGDGVLSVSSQGTGDLARFGNASTFVAWLTTNGTWNALTFNPTSDRNAKENFAGINPREVLDKVTALSLERWNYKVAPGVEHIGPVAQDFHAAFGLNGDDDKHIATVDADSVALAAIQGLNQKLEQRLEQKAAEVAELTQRLEKLEGLMNEKLNGDAQ